MMELSVAGSDGQWTPHGDPVMGTVQRSYETAIRKGSSLSVIVAGLDGFRTINDYLGPIEGDAVLASFAACVGGCLGEVLHLYGDQLIGLLPGKGAQTAIAHVESLREQVGGCLASPIGRITASFGAATHPESVESADELIYGAQAAMYWAKANGGNRVGYWGEVIGACEWKRPGTTIDPVAALAAALERKLKAGPGQLMRSAWYAGKVAMEMGVSAQEQNLIEKAALLHDVGKLTMPDQILQRPGILSEEEKEAVKAHPLMGAKIAKRLPGLAETAPLIAHHHENFDGSGYPDGLAGDAIPLGSRITPVSDAFDAMTTYRSYKSVISLQEALQELHRCSGQQFDRRVVDAFIAIVSRQGLNALHWSQGRRNVNHI
jgi:diguanylate cyclase (GGDEF)-like protein